MRDRNLLAEVSAYMHRSVDDGALMGVKILDLSEVMAGPFCTMLLGDMGAEVIKVEPPQGEPSRRMRGSLATESPGYWGVNRNKRGIVLNLQDSQGAEIGRQLARSADILVENSRPGTLKRLGLGYEALQAVNPRLIYASISGYGQKQIASLEREGVITLCPSPST
jgi:crotonobetainyl-CoA:carnitine CoA-transferase CaiB-like acyl-CoA transferase